MPLLDLQRQASEIGRIRLGTSSVRRGRNGKSCKRPEKLSAFRFTTPSPRAASAVAALLGGEVRPWDAQWEVLTDCTELPVSVPPGEAALNQWWELWGEGLCQRRCDGFKETLRNTECMCPPVGAERTAAAAHGDACKPTTRVNLIIPDLPGIGVWRVESHGFYAAVELGGAAELLAAAREHGQIVPAILRLEAREARRVTGRGTPEEKAETRKYFVPVLEIAATLRELVAVGAGGRLADALPPAPATARALTAAPVAPPASWAAEADGTPGPDCAEDIAARAAQVATASQLRPLWVLAESSGWLDTHVLQPGDDPEDGTWVSLRDYLTDRGKALPGARK